MRPATKAALLLASAALAAGCYVKAENQSVTVTKALPCPAGGCPTFNSAVLGGEVVVEVAFDLGGADFLQPSTDFGPVTLTNSLQLNQVTLQMTPPGSTFAGVALLSLVQVPTSPPAGAGCAPSGSRVLASYDKATSPAADPRVITMAGSGANLLEITGGTSTIVLRICASGAIPGPWNADLTLDTALSGKASFP